MLIFKIIVVILGLIAIATGLNDYWRGAAVEGDFGKKLGILTRDPTLNFTIRFLGGIWMGFGFLLLLFAYDLERYRIALILSFIIIIISGLGRVLSIYKLGIEKENKPMAYGILAVELLLVPLLLGVLLIYL